MSEVIQIAKFTYDLNNKLKFELNFDGLKEWVEPIKDKQVVVIPAVGPTQTGRSFLLNLTGHHLSNKGNEKQITGFESRAGVDPITTGLWLSKPIIIQNDEGKEMAVLLLDTQSVFDGNTSVEDSNKILWLCLLISSCLIINQTSLSEEFLYKLEPFLQYMKTNSGCADSLVILIRDWSKTKIFKYGRKGGDQYLSNRLEIRDNNSKAINSKRWLKNCFKEIECYLWPGLGLNEDEGEFNGSVDRLGNNFKDYFQEFITQSMNANKLTPKAINNKFITGSELCLFFKVYVELFNSTEQPNHLAIATATTRTLDLILIDELITVQHLIQLQNHISRKNGFVSRKSLTDYNKQICGELKTIFDARKKSEYPDVINSLHQSLEEGFQTNFDKVFVENEKCRQNFTRLVVKECAEDYKHLLEKNFRNNQFFDSTDLSEILSNHTKVVFEKFRHSFNGEVEELFEDETQTLENSLSLLGYEFSKENDKRMAESREKNTQGLNESVEYYEKEVQEQLKSNHLLTDQQFADLEDTIKTKTRKLFRKKCCSGDSKFISKFDNSFRERISHLKYDFKEQMKRKREKIIVDIEIDLIDKLEELNKLYQIVHSKHEFEQESLKIKEKLMDELNKRGVTEEQNKAFIRKLDSKISFLLKAFDESSNNKQKFNEVKPLEVAKNQIPQPLEDNPIKNVKYEPSWLLNQAKEVYILSMENLFKEGKTYPVGVLERENNFYNKYTMKTLMDQLHQEGIPSDSQNYKTTVQELKEFISKKYVEYKMQNISYKEHIERRLEDKTEEYFLMYVSLMRDSREGALSETDYLVKHSEAKNQVMGSFREKEIFKDYDTFWPFLPKLEKMIDSSYEEFLKPFQISTEITDERPFKAGEEWAEDEFLAKIIEISPDGKYELNEQLLQSILSKAKNCHNFAFISIIGRKFSSKTFVMNCLKSYLETKDRKSWPKNCTFDYEQGFHSDTNDYSLKPVIQMWEQPFIIESDGLKTAVFMVDSSNVFNDDTEISNTGLVKDVIQLFLNISTTVIFMSGSDSLSKEIETLKPMIEESLSMTSTDKFKELICVLRDWNPSHSENKSYLYGPKSGERYLSEINKLGNNELNKYFNNIYCYLMPSAGSGHKRSTVEFNRLSDQFLVEMTNFIRLKVLNIDEMAVKKVMKWSNDQRSEYILELDQLNKLMRSQVNKLNGMSDLMADSAEDWHDLQYDSESIRVLDRDGIDNSDEEFDSD